MAAVATAGVVCGAVHAANNRYATALIGGAAVGIAAVLLSSLLIGKVRDVCHAWLPPTSDASADVHIVLADALTIRARRRLQARPVSPPSWIVMTSDEVRLPCTNST